MRQVDLTLLSRPIPRDLIYYISNPFKQHHLRRIRQYVHLEHEIPGPLRGAALELDVVVGEDVGEDDLDLVAGEEAAGARVPAEAELHAVVRRARELEPVRVLRRPAPQPVEPEPVERVRVPPLGRRLVQDVGVALHDRPRRHVEPVRERDGDHGLALERS